jgi:hypothetical protein
MRIVKYSEIADAFDFVSSNSLGANEAVLFPETGEIFWSSEDADIDEITPAVASLGEGKCLKIPHKNDLNLGKNLVFEFIEQNLPDEYELIRSYFSRRGAYSRYKDLLSRLSKLDMWYNFENNRIEVTLRDWCLSNGIELEDKNN